mmetsp:Transcript_45206/g.67148  ORF Transcript_45206/g.67148 Transcript_45206/m.67148 type:complete len:121 (+) Transcript_45206:2430-2792(+)
MIRSQRRGSDGSFVTSTVAAFSERSRFERRSNTFDPTDASNAASGSSNKKTFVSEYKALAKATRLRCPPERFAPFSPTDVLSLRTPRDASTFDDAPSDASLTMSCSNPASLNAALYLSSS